ncbi:MAG: Rieske 2Fe-2S domain-containing protein, partial [Cellvibrionales bacterium]
MTTGAKERFPFPIPLGWFHIGFSNDLAPGELTTLERFGQQLVLWRSLSGDYCLQDAFCPHLGAHFGHGGEVVEAGIRCPFHHWVFDTAGRVASIPYADRHSQEA